MRTATPPTTLRQGRATGSYSAPVQHSRISDHSAPEDYTEFYARYYPYVVRLVIDRGISPSNAEDVAQSILEHFFKRNSLDFYDPEHVTERGKTTQFTTFLSGFVLTYLRHHLDRARIEHARQEGLPIDEDPSNEHSWANTSGPRTESDLSGPEFDEFLAAAHRSLSAAKFKGACSLVDLFDALREQVETTGTYSVQALANQFGSTPSTVQNWIVRLRAELADLR